MRVFKKISTPFTKSNPDKAIIVVNANDPQINTVKSFIQACDDYEIGYTVFLNKCDKKYDNENEVLEDIRKQLKLKEIKYGSAKTGRYLRNLKLYLKLWKGKRIIVLGVFNSGKTSIINYLCDTNYEVGDIPGTTLKFTETIIDEDTVIIDSVGQLIDIHKPLMVSIDLSDCSIREEKIDKIFNETIRGLIQTQESTKGDLCIVIDILKECINNGNKIITCGAGASALVSRAIAGQGTECGFPIMVFTNDGAEIQPVSFSKGIGEQEGAISRYISNVINKNDCIIAISCSGGTGFVYDLLRRAKEKEAITIAITENIDTPLGKYADYILKSDIKPEGPCFHPGTPILTHRGLIKIGDVVIGDKLLSIKYAKSHKLNDKYSNVHGFQIRGLKWSEIGNISNSIAQSLYEIRYRNGGVIKVTGNHTLFIIKHTGITPIQASKLKKGDVLISLPKEIKSEEIGLTQKRDLELMELFGYYASEGSLGNRSVIFTIGDHEPNFRDRIIYLMKKKFNCNYKIRDKGDENKSFDIWFYSTKAKKLFEDSCGRGAWHKYIPNILWTSDKNSFVAFIKAYIRGDGNITIEEKSRGRSVSRHMLEELTWLCKLHNIPNSLSEMIQKERMIRNQLLKESKIWQLQIGRNGWKELIGTNKPNIVDCKSPHGIAKRDLNKPVVNRNIIKSIRKIQYNGRVIDIVDCDGDVFYVGNIPILSHNSASKSITAHMTIGHVLMLILADELGITADESVGYMLPEYVPSKSMGLK